MPSSYLISEYYVSSSLHNLVWQRASALTKPSDQRFFLHIVASALVSLSIHDGWSRGIELPCGVIDDIFTHRCSPQAVENAGLIESSSYSTALHKCRAYWVERDLFTQILTAMDQPTEKACHERLVNLIDGEDAPVRRAYQASHIPSPQLLRGSIDRFRSCPFDGTALDAHLARLRADAQSASPEIASHLRQRWRNDVVCANRMRVGSTPRGGGMYEYRPVYRAVYTGRIAEVGGGLQSCLRRMKLAALSTVPDIHNYDLRAAQAFALLQDLEDAGLERGWLSSFLTSPTATDQLARKLKLSRDVVKSCLYAAMMGAPFSTYYDRSKNALYDTLLEYTQDDAVAKEKLTRVHRELRPLKSILDEWHRWLVESDQCLHVDPKRRGRCLVNDCGMLLRLEQIKTGERKRKAAAFVLQRCEAAYVHHLTLLASKYDFVPVSNQHDGLVTIGVVPEAAHDEAKARSGFRYASLVEKPTFGVDIPQGEKAA